MGSASRTHQTTTVAQLTCLSWQCPWRYSIYGKFLIEFYSNPGNESLSSVREGGWASGHKFMEIKTHYCSVLSCENLCSAVVEVADFQGVLTFQHVDLKITQFPLVPQEPVST